MMNPTEQQLFRKWMTQQGHNVLPSRINGRIEFQMKGGNGNIAYVRILARGGIDADYDGELVYSMWRSSGVGASKFIVDVPRVTPDTAVELFIHHLQLTVSYFEATPDDDGAQILEEAARIMNVPSFGETTEFKGLKALVKALVKDYKALSDSAELSVGK